MPTDNNDRESDRWTGVISARVNYDATQFQIFCGQCDHPLNFCSATEEIVKKCRRRRGGISIHCDNCKAINSV